MKGSMVMNYPHEIAQAYQDYSAGKMGRPWDEALTDDEWSAHVVRYPSHYRYRNDKDNVRKRTTKQDDDNDNDDKKYLNSWYYQ
jgi:hypothetical protein